MLKNDMDRNFAHIFLNKEYFLECEEVVKHFLCLS